MLGRGAEHLKQKATGSSDSNGSGGVDPVCVCRNCEEQYGQEVTVCLECDGTEFVTVES